MNAMKNQKGLKKIGVAQPQKGGAKQQTAAQTQPQATKPQEQPKQQANVQQPQQEGAWIIIDKDKNKKQEKKGEGAEKAGKKKRVKGQFDKEEEEWPLKGEEIKQAAPPVEEWSTVKKGGFKN